MNDVEFKRLSSQMLKVDKNDPFLLTPAQICLFSVKICFKFVGDSTSVYFSMKKVI